MTLEEFQRTLTARLEKEKVERVRRMDRMPSRSIQHLYDEYDDATPDEREMLDGFAENPADYGDW